MENVNDKVLEIRKDKNLTQQQFAKIIGVSQSTIALYESGKRNPPPDILIKLSEISGKSLDYIMGRYKD